MPAEAATDPETSSGAAFAAFLDRQYDQLEQTAQRLRTTDTLTKSGKSSLIAFYESFRDAKESCLQDDACWNALYDRTAEWKISHPRSPTPYVVELALRDAEAWSRRGIYYVFWVSGEGARRFRTLLEKTVEDAAAQQAFEPDAGWYYFVIGHLAIMAPDKDLIESFLVRATDLYPDIPDFYFAAEPAFAPRWGNTMQDLYDYADWIGKRTADRHGDIFYARIYWASSFAFLDDRDSDEGKVAKERFDRGVQQLLARYPSAWNANRLMGVYCGISDWANVQKVKATFEQPLPAAWESEAEFMNCVRMAWFTSHREFGR